MRDLTGDRTAPAADHPGGPWMLVFGLGTVPLMMAVGAGVSLVSLRFRQRMLKVAAWCVIATGVMSMVRGVYAFPAGADDAETATAASCPLCDA